MSEARITIYEKPTCTMCRAVVKLLTERGVDFDRVDYMIERIPREKLVELLRKMEARPRDIVRPKEARALGVDRDADDETLLDALAEHPELVQRPILERGDRAVLGRPPERAVEILD